MSENDYSLQCEKVQRLEESLQKVVTQFNRIIFTVKFWKSFCMIIKLIKNILVEQFYMFLSFVIHNQTIIRSGRSVCVHHS